MDKARWDRVSPLLDHLLDAAPGSRPTLLAAVRQEDAALADDLHDLLERLEAVERDAFLEGHATLRGAGMAGQTVGAYTIECELGEGGMGSVWLARRTDGRYEGNVAIKFLHGAGVPPRGSAERFAREGSILARLAHPNIARLIDAGITPAGGQRYLVLEYVDGMPIDRYCQSHALEVAGRVRLFLGVLAAVAHAHNRLILHRDLKPANILVTTAGEVKLLDFGIAKLLDQPTGGAPATELTRLAGRAFTPAFAAPEQVEDGDVTTATDVYALGVLLYLLLAGSHPTVAAGATPLEQIQSVVETEPPRLSEAAARQGGEAARCARLLRGDLDTIVAKALKKAPEERYANAQQFADDLQRYLNDEPIAARPDAPGYVVAKFVRRHRVGVAAGAAAMLALAVGAGVAVWEASEARRQREQAEGLIEFMLGDLRRKLEPVGRLDVLDAVGDRALAYYAAQDAGRMDADALGRRSRALHLIGEIAELRGNLDEASRVFQRAAESTGELVQRYPQNGQRIFDHAQSVYWVGYMARRRGFSQDAQTSFEQYRRLAQRLVDLEPGRPDWRSEAAWAAHNLGVVHLEAMQAARARELFREAGAIWVTLVPGQAELGLELSNTLGWAAKAEEALGAFDLAIRYQQEKIDTLHKVPAAGNSRSVQRLLANAHYEIGRLHLALGRSRPAAQAALDGLRLFEALVALDGSNLEWLAQLAFAQVSLAEIQASLDERDSARAHVEHAAAHLARLAAADAVQTKWNIALKGAVLLQQARLASGAGEAELIERMGAYLALAQPGDRAVRLDAEQVRIVAAVELALGDLLASRSGPAAASRWWQAAARRLEGAGSGNHLAAAALLAHAHLRLGQVGEARRLGRQLERSTYRHPVYADLRQRLEHATGGGTRATTQ